MFGFFWVLFRVSCICFRICVSGWLRVFFSFCWLISVVSLLLINGSEVWVFVMFERVILYFFVLCIR